MRQGGGEEEGGGGGLCVFGLMVVFAPRDPHLFVGAKKGNLPVRGRDGGRAGGGCTRGGAGVLQQPRTTILSYGCCPFVVSCSSMIVHTEVRYSCIEYDTTLFSLLVLLLFFFIFLFLFWCQNTRQRRS